MKDVKITLYHDGWTAKVDNNRYSMSHEDEDLGAETVKKLLEYLGYKVTLKEDC